MDFNYKAGIAFTLFISMMMLASMIGIGEAQTTEWCDQSLEYRKPITITNENNTVPIRINYTVNFTIDTTDLSRFWINGSNLKICRGATEVNRINLSVFNDSSTEIYFPIIEQIPGGNSDTYYIYYGRNRIFPTAFTEPLKDIDEIFIIYEDWDNGLNYSKWLVQKSGTGPVINVTDGQLVLYQQARNGADNMVYLLSERTLNGSELNGSGIIMKISHTGNVVTQGNDNQKWSWAIAANYTNVSRVGICDPFNDDNIPYSCTVDGRPASEEYYRMILDDTTWHSDGPSGSGNNRLPIRNFTVRFYDGNFTVFDGVEVINTTSWDLTDPVKMGVGMVSADASSFLTRWDNFSLRLLVLPEPTLTLGNEQQVSPIQICGNITNQTTLNFTFRNENNLSETLRADFDIAFTSIYKEGLTNTNVSFSFTNVTNAELCILPTNESYTVSSIATYNVSGFAYRRHFLQNAVINNQTQTIVLYTSPSDSNQQVIFTVTDIYKTRLSNIVLDAQRFYVGENTYRSIAMGKTDSQGQAPINIQPDYFYRFILTQNNQVLRVFDPKIITTSDTTLELNTEEAALSEYFEYFDNVATSCTFNNNTNILSCVAIDTTGLMQEVYLKVEQIKLNETFSTICDETGTGTSVTLTCNLTDQVNSNATVSYAFSGRFCCSDPNVAVFVNQFLNFGTIVSGFAGVGLFVTLIVLLPLVMIGRFSPVVSIIFANFWIIIASVMGLITGLTMGAFMSLACVGAIIIWKLRE